MSNPMTAPQILDREFLEVRAKILEIAAAFDRWDRAEGDVDGDPRVSQIREAIDLLSAEDGNRAEQVQLVFSRTYDEKWREAFGLATADSSSR